MTRNPDFASYLRPIRTDRRNRVGDCSFELTTETDDPAGFSSRWFEFSPPKGCCG